MTPNGRSRHCPLNRWTSRGTCLNRFTSSSSPQTSSGGFLTSCRRNLRSARLVCRHIRDPVSPLLFLVLQIRLDQTSLDVAQKGVKKPPPRRRRTRYPGRAPVPLGTTRRGSGTVQRSPAEGGDACRKLEIFTFGKWRPVPCTPVRQFAGNVKACFDNYLAAMLSGPCLEYLELHFRPYIQDGKKRIHHMGEILGAIKNPQMKKITITDVSLHQVQLEAYLGRILRALQSIMSRLLKGWIIH
ncbi:hypothetical protein CDV55_101641 [Aspergillus turcosus]|uniref:Uncharacterized protein n=1 Tax=Aspergillus turcosus TaxID=1245748 RepID=A0A229YMD3_9EURO|nr:hypothetical protein CDV55_101641 [Aspergillus turcosus]RLL94557.1 hypothetical protein CFD26_103932 [Aspergillus turcosus]